MREPVRRNLGTLIGKDLPLGVCGIGFGIRGIQDVPTNIFLGGGESARHFRIIGLVQDDPIWVFGSLPNPLDPPGSNWAPKGFFFFFFFLGLGLEEFFIF
jgi:hypothetical protein